MLEWPWCRCRHYFSAWRAAAEYRHGLWHMHGLLTGFTACRVASETINIWHGRQALCRQHRFLSQRLVGRRQSRVLHATFIFWANISRQNRHVCQILVLRLETARKQHFGRALRGWLKAARRRRMLRRMVCIIQRRAASRMLAQAWAAWRSFNLEIAAQRHLSSLQQTITALAHRTIQLKVIKVQAAHCCCATATLHL
jgi:hypothetical protein